MSCCKIKCGKGLSLCPCLPREEYGFLYTPNAGLTLSPFTTGGFPIPGTSAFITNLPASSLAAIIPWTNNDVLINIKRLPSAAKIRKGGNISLEYTLTPSLTVTFPQAISIGTIPALALATVEFQAALYAVIGGTAIEIPGTRQVLSLGVIGLLGVAFGLLAGQPLPLTFALTNNLEIVGQGLTRLIPGTQIVLVLSLNYNGFSAIPSSALPIFNFVPNTGTLASLKIIKLDEAKSQDS